MDRAALASLKQRIHPVTLSGTLTLEQASLAIALNRDVARFHAVVAQAERILELAGEIDARLEQELNTRAAELSAQSQETRERLSGEADEPAARDVGRECETAGSMRE